MINNKKNWEKQGKKYQTIRTVKTKNENKLNKDKNNTN